MKREPIVESKARSRQRAIQIELHRPSWDEYFMLIAKLAAIRTTCLSRAVGSVIVVDRQVVSTGYNGSVPGAPHCSDEGRCYKRAVAGPETSGRYELSRAVHAEANAVGMAARRGISVKGGTLYTTLAPCATCVKLLSSAGIARVVYEKTYDTAEGQTTDDWAEALDQAGIKHEQLSLSPTTVEKALQVIAQETSRRKALTGDGLPAIEESARSNLRQRDSSL
jgi:dCMP deaminase